MLASSGPANSEDIFQKILGFKVSIFQNLCAFLISNYIWVIIKGIWIIIDKERKKSEKEKLKREKKKESKEKNDRKNERETLRESVCVCEREREKEYFSKNHATSFDG